MLSSRCLESHMVLAGVNVMYTTWQSYDSVAPLVFLKSLKEGLWCIVPSVLVKEQAEEVYWLFTVSLHLWVGAKVWRVELTGVGNPNDVVEEAREQKGSNITMTWLQIFLIFKSRSLSFLLNKVIFFVTVLKLMWTNLVNTHPNWSVWYTVLTGMHPNSVTVLMNFPV